jgi:hypothetical protein
MEACSAETDGYVSKGRKSSNERVWAVGFYNVVARFHLARILKLMKSGQVVELTTHII